MKVGSCSTEKSFGEVIDLERYCRFHGFPFEEITPVGELNKYFKRGREFLAYVENVQVIADGFLVTDRGIITRGLSNANYWNGIEGKLLGYQRQEGPEIEKAILCWGNRNFSHFVFQFLTRMTLCLGRDFMDWPVLLKRGLPASYKTWLKRLGFTEFIEADDWVRVKRLWVPSVCCYRGHYDDIQPYASANACHTLRKLLITRPGNLRKVYISRKFELHRRVLNEDELLAALPGFECIERMDKMTLDEQIDSVSSAETIVLTNGGASAITLFAPKTCNIVELNNPYLTGSFGSMAWASILKQRFSIIRGPEEPDFGEPTNRNFTVPIPDVVNYASGHSARA